MEIKQTVDLTYNKVDEIDKKINRVLVKSSSANDETKLNENSTKLNEIATTTDTISTTTNEINTNICSINNEISEQSTTINQIDTKVDEINTKTQNIETINSNVGEILSSNAENSTKIENIKTKVDTLSSDIETISTNINSINTQTQNLTTINNNITTINSNTATTNNNVSTIKSNVEKITNRLPSGNYNNEVIQKLDEILKTVKQNANEDTFETDPYKLDMEYTGKIETDRNPNNYDFFETTKTFETHYGIFFARCAHCSSSTFNIKIEVSFTSTTNFNLTCRSNCFNNTTQSYQLGTNTFTFNKENVTVVNDRIIVHLEANKEITIHSIKLELWGDNMIILPKRKKYKVSYSLDKIIISKTENDNGYYMILNSNALYPDLLNQEYTLGQENVLDFCIGYDWYNYLGFKKCAMGLYSAFITLDCVLMSYYDGVYYPGKSNESSLICTFGYFNERAYISYLGIDNLTPTQFYMKKSSYIDPIYLRLEQGNVGDSFVICDMSKFDSSIVNAQILTTIQGKIYFAFNSNYNIEIGYGKNATGVYDPNDPLKAHVYFNDGGYCVKVVIGFNAEHTELQILSRRIIGTYDTYFETNSNVYLVEKNGELYMFKNN